MRRPCTKSELLFSSQSVQRTRIKEQTCVCHLWTKKKKKKNVRIPRYLRCHTQTGLLAKRTRAMVPYECSPEGEIENICRWSAPTPNHQPEDRHTRSAKRGRWHTLRHGDGTHTNTRPYSDWMCPRVSPRFLAQGREIFSGQSVSAVDANL